jgi:hypothetical protein
MKNARGAASGFALAVILTCLNVHAFAQHPVKVSSAWLAVNLCWVLTPAMRCKPLSIDV